MRYVLCDVFTERALAGKPLAVFTDARGLEAEALQALAREMGLSETAFVLPPKQGGHARLRIFTPSAELSYAAHPTLGAAFVLAGPLQALELRLELEVGVIPVRLEREAARISFAWMQAPKTSRIVCEAANAVLQALGVRSEVPCQAYESGGQRLLVSLPSAAHLAALRPDLAALSQATAAGVYAFHFDGKGCTARYFAPRAGVNEDPATGSAAASLALYLREQGRLAPTDILRIDQGAEIGRPSTLYAQVGGGEDPHVEVGGAARIVARGQFTL